VRPGLVDFASGARSWNRFRASSGTAAPRRGPPTFEPSTPNAFPLQRPADLFLTEAFQEGRLEIQDLASQLVGCACDPAPRRDLVGRLCRRGRQAAPSRHLMQNKDSSGPGGPVRAPAPDPEETRRPRLGLQFPRRSLERRSPAADKDPVRRHPCGRAVQRRRNLATPSARTLDCFAGRCARARRGPAAAARSRHRVLSSPAAASSIPCARSPGPRRLASWPASPPPIRSCSRRPCFLRPAGRYRRCPLKCRIRARPSVSTRTLRFLTSVTLWPQQLNANGMFIAAWKRR